MLSEAKIQIPFGKPMRCACLARVRLAYIFLKTEGKKECSFRIQAKYWEFDFQIDKQ
jgi:hypothetical protein